MAVNTTEISSVYSTLLSAMIAKYDIMWTDNEIDAETYAKMVGQASSQLVQLSADLVQKQESLEADNSLKAKQLEIATQELAIKVYEVTNLLPEQLAKIQEEVDLLQTQDLNALEQVKLVYTERVLKDKQASKLGLDNAMKLSETSRAGDANNIYTPKYEAI